jgi:hypothetical protein
MTISPNRQSLKDLANLNIDAQFCQQYGVSVFNYQGDFNPHYAQICGNLESVLDDLVKHLQAIKAQIPLTTDSQ